MIVVALVASSNSQGYRKLRTEDACPEQGFFQDANDCQKFYRCAELPTETGSVPQRYEFNCPPGTVFDENISVCNHPQNVDQVSPQCLAAVGATLEEIYRRPSNEDGQYHTKYHYQPTSSNTIQSVVATKPYNNNLNNYNKNYNNNYNKGPSYNVIQHQPQQAVFQTPYQVPQYQHQQVVYQSQPIYG